MCPDARKELEDSSQGLAGAMPKREVLGCVCVCVCVCARSRMRLHVLYIQGKGFPGRHLPDTMQPKLLPS